MTLALSTFLCAAPTGAERIASFPETTRPDEPALIGSSGRNEWLPIHDSSRTNGLTFSLLWLWQSTGNSFDAGEGDRAGAPE